MLDCSCGVRPFARRQGEPRAPPSTNTTSPISFPSAARRIEITRLAPALASSICCPKHSAQHRILPGPDDKAAWVSRLA